MPAATRQGPWSHGLVTAGRPRPRPEHAAIYDLSRRVYPATNASPCHWPDRRWPRSNRIRSGLTFHQPVSVKMTVLDGPWDPGNPSAARQMAGRRLPRSHGPSEGRVKGLSVNISLLFDAAAPSTDFSSGWVAGTSTLLRYAAAPTEATERPLLLIFLAFLRMRGKRLPLLRDAAAPTVAVGRRLSRSNWPPQACIRCERGRGLTGERWGRAERRGSPRLTSLPQQARE
jgi:hypothetical protein